MAEVEFQVVYDGPALRNGRIPVRDLAPSLFALGELFSEANRLLNPPRVSVILEAQATDRSSFDVLLVLRNLGEWAYDIFSDEPANALNNFKDLVLGGPGLLGLILSIRRRRIVAVEPAPSVGQDAVVVRLEDGSGFATTGPTVSLYRDWKVRSRVRETVAVVGTDGIEKMEFRDRESELTVTVNAEDVAEFAEEAPEPTDDLVSESVEDGVALTIESIPITHPSGTWRFDDGEHAFSATMEDPTFVADVVAQREQFVAGDILSCRMRRRQYRTPSGRLRNERAVLNVREHRRGEPPAPGLF